MCEQRGNIFRPSHTNIALTVSHAIVGTMIENSYFHPPLAPSPPITAEEAVVSELLEHGRPLTQRALRYLRQSVRRVGEDDFSDRLKSTQLTELGSILRKNGPADEYDLHAQMSITKRDFDDEANHPPFDSI